MFSSFCAAMGLAGWLLMLTAWIGTVALAVWAITRLFPARPRRKPPADETSTSAPRSLTGVGG